jgi:hypothetical protein
MRCQTAYFGAIIYCDHDDISWQQKMDEAGQLGFDIVHVAARDGEIRQVLMKRRIA